MGNEDSGLTARPAKVGGVSMPDPIWESRDGTKTMNSGSCPHEYESKRFYFKWWLCPDCYADLPRRLEEVYKRRRESDDN